MYYGRLKAYPSTFAYSLPFCVLYFRTESCHSVEEVHAASDPWSICYSTWTPQQDNSNLDSEFKIDSSSCTKTRAFRQRIERDTKLSCW